MQPQPQPARSPAIVASSWFGHAVQVADDMVVIIPKHHADRLNQRLYELSHPALIRQAVAKLGWRHYTEYRSVGANAGQRHRGGYRYVKRRNPGLPSSGLEPDALERRVNELAALVERLERAYGRLGASLGRHD